MKNLIVTCNYTLSDNFSPSNLHCGKAENISESFHEDTISQKVFSTSQNVIALLGMVTNLVVVIVLLNHKEFRQKIPNIFIINQVSEEFRCSVHKLHESRRQHVSVQMTPTRVSADYLTDLLYREERKKKSSKIAPSGD